MAQDFVGANNMPLLESSGMFGTRLEGGKDAASARYIFTKLSEFVRTVYPRTDEDLLEYLEDDGQSVEPRYYAPIIPMVLVNGIQGIGTGWSTSIPPHHPSDLIEDLRKRLTSSQNHDGSEIVPWFRGFSGNVSIRDPIQRDQVTDILRYFTSGLVKVLSKTKVEITELPIGKWTNDYKSFLLGLIEEDVIKDFKELHTAASPHFILTFQEGVLRRIMKETPNSNASLLRNLKLVSSISASNMVAFSETGDITKYSSPSEIMDAFFNVRYQIYSRRKARDEKMLENKTRFLDQKMKFIRCVLSGEINLTSGLSSVQIKDQLHDLGFDTHELDVETSQNIDNNRDMSSYLLSLPLRTFTEENIDKSQRDRDSSVETLLRVKEETVEEMWLKDLDKLEILLNQSPGYKK